MGSSFVRSGGLKGRLNDDRTRLHEHHKKEPLRTFDEKVLSDEWVHLTQSFSALRISGVVEKIVRCLHFASTGAPLAREAQLTVDVTPLTTNEERSLYDGRSGCVGHHDEFVFRREASADAHTRWLLGFYRHHTFTVTVNASYL